MNSRWKRLWPIGVALGAGLILPFAFAPFNIFPIAFLSPALLLYAFLNASKWQAFFRGFWFGVGYFGVGASWVYISIHNFGNANVPVALLLTVLFIAVLALFFATQGYVFSGCFGKKSKVSAALLAFPATWVIWEWLRSWVFSGFPWLYLGSSQLHLPLSGFIPLFGVYGVSLLVVLLSGCLYLLCIAPLRLKIASLLFATVIIIVGIGLSFYSWVSYGSSSLSVSLIQGNVPQYLKWDIQRLQSTLHTYLSLTQKQWHSRLIVWPEAAIPAFPEQIPNVLDSLDDQAHQHNTSLILGIPIQNKQAHQAFNGLRVLGQGNGTYLKRHLVPFGEYTPLAWLFKPIITRLHIPLSDLDAGPSQQPPTTAQGVAFAPFICYEIAYPIAALASIKNTGFIVVVSDDSWFGNSPASAQQLQMAQMRSKETGRYTLYATNTGITAIIRPDGTLQAIAPENKKTVLEGSIQIATGKTPLMQWNYYPVLGLVIVFLGVSLRSRNSKV